MSRLRSRLSLALLVLLGLGGCVAYGPGYGRGYGHGGGYYYSGAPAYVAPSVRHGGGGWWGGNNHHRGHHHRRHHDDR